MTNIKLIVEGAQARAEVDGVLTSGMVGISVTIECDDAWNELTKNLVCRGGWGNEQSYGITKTVLKVGSTATVAHEVMVEGRELYLGLEGYNADGTLVIPTTWACCGEIRAGAQSTGDSTAEPALPVWAQVKQELERVPQIINSALRDAKNSGEFNGRAGNGIESVEYNDDYTLTLNMDDETSYTTSSIRGATGADGQNGLSIYFTTEEATADDFPFDPGCINNKGRELQAGDMLLTPSMKLFSVYGVSSGTIDAVYIITLKGENGVDGDTPIKGEDYWTEDDKSTIITDVLEAIDSTNYSSPLYGKKIVYDGDSICYGAGYAGGYGKLIAQRVSGTYENHGLGGGRLITAGENGTYHSVVDNLKNLPADGDLYCFEGGINDYWTKSVLGSYDGADFDNELDASTVCGALETIFRYCLSNFVGKPICFVITHKIQRTAYSANANGDSFKDYHDAMMGICEKYSIPYYDAFNKSGLNGWNSAQNYAYLTGNSEEEPDGCHPNEEGYKRYYVPQLIALFESMMPMAVTEPELPAGPAYTNILDEVGYSAGVYLTGTGVEGVDSAAYTTGYIPVNTQFTIYLKNVTMPDNSSHGNRIALYDVDKNCIANAQSVTSAQENWEPVFDANGNLTQFYMYITGAAYIRISAWLIDDTSIITIDEPIE